MTKGKKSTKRKGKEKDAKILNALGDLSKCKKSECIIFMADMVGSTAVAGKWKDIPGNLSEAGPAQISLAHNAIWVDSIEGQKGKVFDIVGEGLFGFWEIDENVSRKKAAYAALGAIYRAFTLLKNYSRELFPGDNTTENEVQTRVAIHMGTMFQFKKEEGKKLSFGRLFPGIIFQNKKRTVDTIKSLCHFFGSDIAYCSRLLACSPPNTVVFSDDFVESSGIETIGAKVKGVESEAKDYLPEGFSHAEIEDFVKWIKPSNLFPKPEDKDCNRITFHNFIASRWKDKRVYALSRPGALPVTHTAFIANLSERAGEYVAAYERDEFSIRRWRIDESAKEQLKVLKFLHDFLHWFKEKHLTNEIVSDIKAWRSDGVSGVRVNLHERDNKDGTGLQSQDVYADRLDQIIKFVMLLMVLDPASFLMSTRAACIKEEIDTIDKDSGGQFKKWIRKAQSNPTAFLKTILEWNCAPFAKDEAGYSVSVIQEAFWRTLSTIEKQSFDWVDRIDWSIKQIIGIE